MLSVKILAVGKAKEKHYRDACGEYAKRLSRFLKLEITELPDEKAGEELSEAQKERVKELEGQRILGRLEGCVIALDVNGEQWDTVRFARELDRLTQSYSRISFVIGGSLGLSEEVLSRADLRLSFSPMTFCHPLARVMLLEQLYRAEKIINNQPYHK